MIYLAIRNGLFDIGYSASLYAIRCTLYFLCETNPIFADFTPKTLVLKKNKPNQSQFQMGSGTKNSPFLHLFKIPQIHNINLLCLNRYLHCAYLMPTIKQVRLHTFGNNIYFHTPVLRITFFARLIWCCRPVFTKAANTHTLADYPVCSHNI